MSESDVPAAPPGGNPDPFAPAAEDDPFARALAVDSTPASGPLARRDPDAALDESAEYHVAGAASFDDVLRRARRRGFLAGTAAGALAATAVAAALALFTASTGVPTREGVAEPDVVGIDLSRPAGPPRGAWRSRPPSSKAPVPVPAPARREERQAAVVEAPPVPQAAVAEATVPPDPVPGPAADAPGREAPELAHDDPGPAAPPAPVDAREVAEALRARRGAVDDCVASTPGDASAARGQSFWLSVVIEPTGEVSEARIDDPEIEATPLGACLVRLARAMSFAPFEGGPASVKLALLYGGTE